MPDFLANLPTTTIALAIGAFVIVSLLQRIPVIGGVIRIAISLVLVVAVALLLTERMPFDPLLSSIANRFNLGGQQVEGDETRLRMSANGHFFADVTLNGVKRRMLIDSGATVTALSQRTAAAAGIRTDASVIPVIIQTANGSVRAETGEVDELRLGNIVARDLKVVVSPAFGSVDVIGMNLLSKLKSWRVEGRTLILTPNNPQAVAGKGA
ncbi:retropepsin-like aspartic protease [Sphingomonas sp.]|uniref:retropepsin-like aspartic protease family protein n=1 Tax=Sphingomonas sp. TaxID=28214 RepID=UPI002DEC720D|nr:retropepsin-like aspartic protease [Sphingomonas sp.]